MASKIQAWLHAFRLRTLPLAFSSIITGACVAYTHNREYFNFLTLSLCFVTTLLLQVLSNLANDYGDSEKGTDNEDRIGPKRAVQAGLLSFKEIKTGIIIASLLALSTGLYLIYEGTKNLTISNSLVFLLLGLGAIVAAIKYTVGKSAYGYQGLGDIFVLLFFGWVGVGGSYYLLAQSWDRTILLPATAIGLLATAVLNLNNMRDRISDAKSNKITMAVRLGFNGAKRYHYSLFFAAIICIMVYGALVPHKTFIFLLVFMLMMFVTHIKKVSTIQVLSEFDPLLKQVALGTFAFSILFGLALILG
jgi:1,4-dihydroxy-2-naphthoate octaprenyltransferase